MDRRKGVRRDIVRGAWSAALDGGEPASRWYCIEQPSSIVTSGDRKRFLTTTLRSPIRAPSPASCRNYSEHLDSSRNVWCEWQRPTSGFTVHEAASFSGRASRDFVESRCRPNGLKEKARCTSFHAWSSSLRLSTVCGADPVFCSSTLLISSTFSWKTWK